MDHVLTLFDDRVGIAAVLMTLVAAAFSVAVARRSSRRRGGQWFAALAASIAIVSVTLVNRGVATSQHALAHDLAWWRRNWTTLPGLVTGDIGWWLNVALFVPAGVTWTLLTRRPLAVVGALVATSAVIETLHAVALTGAGDPTDLVANSLGAALGVTVALGWVTATERMLGRAA